MTLYKRLVPALLALLTIGFALPASAQSGPRLGCIDTAVRRQAEVIKQHFVRQGFTVFRDAMISMSSMEPFPVLVDLKRGQLYQVIFVGSKASYRLKMDVLDGRDQLITSQVAARNREQPNYILYSFSPDNTDTYLFSFMQRLKSKDMCGSLCILRLDKKEATIMPYTGGR